jgi:hypothetical protein
MTILSTLTVTTIILVLVILFPFAKIQIYYENTKEYCVNYLNNLSSKCNFVLRPRF